MLSGENRGKLRGICGEHKKQILIFLGTGFCYSDWSINGLDFLQTQIRRMAKISEGRG